MIKLLISIILTVFFTSCVGTLFESSSTKCTKRYFLKGKVLDSNDIGVAEVEIKSIALDDSDDYFVTKTDSNGNYNVKYRVTAVPWNKAWKNPEHANIKFVKNGHVTMNATKFTESEVSGCGDISLVRNISNF